jgi:serine protease
MRLVSPNLVASLAITLLATACGGGGGGSSTNSVPTPDPVPAPAPVPPELLRISGTITASDSQAVDGDTNDPVREVISNDSVASAQPIPNPITLGGYINQPGTGAPGRSQMDGDIDDFFRVELLAGQSVTMLVADFEQGDADLYLWDTQGNILDFSTEGGRSKHW